jgi:DNA-binding transcriptional regulator YhcF (GntR family)
MDNSILTINKPLYLKIADYIIKNIYDDCFKDNKLPSIRKLALEFDVSIITIKKHINFLENMNLIASHPKKKAYLITDNAKQIIFESKKKKLKTYFFI